ncbi:PREDICTED: uncharacterized protein LOC108663277 [Theobroma cacao]|uniref:Uncharacterized protein LOC108663277 n=1 Tax=Theobroma cacao TaxID=3641 RepID=A0AB32WWE4_THECC|nr:PREDICTED: uncharacterized protein LOC108663277 [Theobroma cacao]
MIESLNDSSNQRDEAQKDKLSPTNSEEDLDADNLLLLCFYVIFIGLLMTFDFGMDMERKDQKVEQKNKEKERKLVERGRKKLREKGREKSWERKRKRNENSALFFGTVLLHFEGGKESFLLQFLEEEKAEIFELEILEVLLPLKGAEKLELFAANLCRKIGQHCAANLKEKKKLGVANFLRKRELKVLPPEEEENDPRKRGSHGGEERKTWW